MAEASKTKSSNSRVRKISHVDAMNAKEAMRATKRQCKNFEKPLYVCGEVVKGFQRGREMNCRTANIADEAISDEARSLPQGVYWTLARRKGFEEIHPAVSSWGDNPYFKNGDNTLEIHILHDFHNEDFYREELEVLICGYMRPMWDFTTFEALVQWIEDDKVHGLKMLEQEECQDFKRRFDEFRANSGKL